MSDSAALTARGIMVRYQGVVANQDVSIDLNHGSVTGLIGPNGAGKTSFLDALSGFTEYDGTVAVDSEPIDHLPPHERRRRGLARSWQAGELFNGLTVLENVLVAASRIGLRTPLRDVLPRRRAGQANHEQAMDALALVGLDGMADRRPLELSLAHQKLVGVARAVVGSPTVVLLDEPAAGLDPQQSSILGTSIRRLAELGPAVLLVDHNVNLVLEVCETITVLDFGKVIASGRGDEVAENENVIAAYLGSPKAE